MMNAIDEVREGMDVVSAAGKKLGTVESFKMGDPEAITAQGQNVGEERGPIAEVVADAFGVGPEIPDEMAERLLRLGYIRIDARGLGEDWYTAADQIDRVEDDTVYLTV